jgi:hypothetical protein
MKEKHIIDMEDSSSDEDDDDDKKCKIIRDYQKWEKKQYENLFKEIKKVKSEITG